MTERLESKRFARNNAKGDTSYSVDEERREHPEAVTVRTEEKKCREGWTDRWTEQVCVSLCVSASVGVRVGGNQSNTKSPGQELTLQPVRHRGPQRAGMRPQCGDKLCQLHNYIERGLTAEPAKPAGITACNICTVQQHL